MMQGSASEHSYALNSDAQNVGFHSAAKPHLGKAIQHLLSNISFLTSTQVPAKQRRHIVAVADLGCAHGRNTLDCAEFVMHSLLASATAHNSLGHGSAVMPDIQYFFSDLPSNDFNALFQSLEPDLHQADDVLNADALPKFFAAGVPGSFYDCLFPRASLDLVICSYSLHWLSQVPPTLVDKNSPAWNGGHVWISRTKPSKPVIDAYARQSETDVRRFLRHRARELTSGGILFLLLVASTSYTEESQSVSANDFCDFLDWAWKEMVDEGLIASESMDTFNIPWYFFNQQELESALKDVPELRVLQMESITDMAFFQEQGDRMQTVEQWVRAFSSIVKPTVEAHVGKSNADELFKKLKTICLNQDCFDAPMTHSAIVASLQRLEFPS